MKAAINIRMLKDKKQQIDFKYFVKHKLTVEFLESHITEAKKLAEKLHYQGKHKTLFFNRKYFRVFIPVVDKDQMLTIIKKETANEASFYLIFYALFLIFYKKDSCGINNTSDNAAVVYVPEQDQMVSSSSNLQDTQDDDIMVVKQMILEDIEGKFKNDIRNQVLRSLDTSYLPQHKLHVFMISQWIVICLLVGLFYLIPSHIFNIIVNIFVVGWGVFLFWLMTL